MSEAKPIDVIFKILGHGIGIGSLGLLNWFLYKARTNKVNYGKVTINFNNYGELDVETIGFAIGLIFLTGYSIWDIAKYLREHY